MTIHQDGYIFANDKVVYLDKNLTMLTQNDPVLINPIKVKINLPQFRIIKIDLTTLTGDLYEYHNGEPIVYDKRHYYDTWKDNKPYENFQVSIQHKNFHKEKKRFVNFLMQNHWIFCKIKMDLLQR